MEKNGILYFILIVVNSICFLKSESNGKCGYPGKPYKAKLEPDNKLQYLEGEEVTYQCTDYWSQIKTRKCERGHWTGQQPRCGEFIKNIQTNEIKVEDISNPYKPIIKFEHLNMALINRESLYPNAFASDRFKRARLLIFDNKRYKWSIKLTQEAVKLFVRINFNFINYTLLTNQRKQNFTLNISLFVSPERKCVLQHQSDDNWNQYNRTIENDFQCDSLSQEAYDRDIENPGDYLYMETQSSLNIAHELIAIYLGKSCGTPKEPICGEPELSVSHYSRFNEQYRIYLIECKNKKWLDVSKVKDVIYASSVHSMTCKADMIWHGTYPACIPLITCPLNTLLISENSNHTQIVSLNGLYFFNSTQYAYEGTEALYGCTGSNDIFVGKEMRTCLKNGSWTIGEPYCYDPNESAKFPLLLVVGILGGALTLVIILTATLFYIYTKRIRNRITKQIQKTNRPESERFDTYDDIENIEGKDIYNAYDTPDEEVRYADPYYSAERDYVQMPRNIQIPLQSSRDYWRIPTVESPYLEMKSTSKPQPSPRRSLKNDEKYILFDAKE